ncbi:MAG: protein kinase, partial [Kofleriaceae bacterium]|nr:protein kinase [Kofleriaceae bacterium]
MIPESLIPESPRCLDDNELASYVDGTSSQVVRARHEQHLGLCQECGATLAIFAKALSTNDTDLGDERYRIESLLGRGSMGSVYRAYDHVLKRTIALKFLGTPGHNSDNPERVDALEQEAVALAKLSHPNVVGIYEIGVMDNKSYAAMEFIDGKTLTGWLDDSPRDWTEILAVLIQAGQGVLAAHHAGVVHRDIKPSNILVGTDKRVRIVDFGLARTGRTSEDVADGSERSSVVTSMAGTPAYRAPELGQNQLASPLSDQYSFCVTAYEALCGARPEEVAPEQRQTIPNHILRVLTRGLSPRADQRYPSMAELLKSLGTPVQTHPKNARITLIAVSSLLVSAIAIYASIALWSSSSSTNGDWLRAQQIQYLQDRSDRVKELGDNGDYSGGLALCDELLASAKRISHAPLTTKLLLDKGQMQTLLSDLSGAEKTYREAASAAARAGDNHQVAEVWIKVLDVLTLQNRFEEALTLRVVAITSAERVPDNEILQARLHRSLGAIYFALGRYHEAYESFDTALAAFRTLGDGAPKWLPSLLGNLALAKMELGDLSGALADMKEATSLSIDALGSEHPQVGYLRLNIASLLTTMNSLSPALENLDKTMTIFKKHF